MDEATKILIGTISGFVIAFLAEPVKGYFNNNTLRSRLRRVLYHEVYENFMLFKKLLQKDLSGISSQDFFQRTLQKDGYEYAISNEITTFYQLKEAIIFNELYLFIKYLCQINITNNQDALKEMISLYIESVENGFKDKSLDKQFMVKTVGKKKFQEFNGVNNES